MFPSAYDFKEYYALPQGRAVAHVVSRRIRDLWPVESLQGLTVAGMGYAMPFLDAYGNVAKRQFCLLSASMGAIRWPDAGKSQVALIHRGDWPLPDATIDRLVMVHDLEFARNPVDLLHEAWRTLTPEGRLIIVVPNRTGLWARAEHTPFGHGRPYTAGQIRTMLKDTGYVVEKMGGALLFPPFHKAFWIRAGNLIIEPMAGFCPVVSGIHVIEATKRLYAPLAEPVAAKRQRAPMVGLPVPSGS